MMQWVVPCSFIILVMSSVVWALKLSSVHCDLFSQQSPQCTGARYAQDTLSSGLHQGTPSGAVLGITRIIHTNSINDLSWHKIKYTGVSSMFPIEAKGNLPFLLSFCNFYMYNFIFPSTPAGSLCESDVYAHSAQ